MKKYTINGYYNRGGQERFMIEILQELDKMVNPGQIEILIPPKVPFKQRFENIAVKRSGPANKFLWVQFFFPIYTFFKKSIGVNMFNICPLIKPDVVAIHDLTPVFFRDIYKSFKGRLSFVYGEMCRRVAKLNAKIILTVSETSKDDISKVYGINPDRIVVLGNSWQHILKTNVNDKILEKYSFLNKEEYFLTVGSILPHKNIKWVYEVAKRNPRSIFVIVGGMAATTNKKDLSESLENVRYLGRLDDSDLFGLMSYCKAFLHPSLYEGFGIPPMEALAFKRPIIISNTSCLPEIYGDAAHYIDPYEYDVDLDNLLSEKIGEPAAVLDKYSWRNIAKRLFDALK